MKYEQLDPITIDEAKSILALGTDPNESAMALLRLSLSDVEREKAEEVLLESLGDRHFTIRKAAIKALGHLARIHHSLKKEVVIAELERLRSVKSLTGTIDDAIDDINMFVK